MSDSDERFQRMVKCSVTYASPRQEQAKELVSAASDQSTSDELMEIGIEVYLRMHVRKASMELISIAPWI